MHTNDAKAAQSAAEECPRQRHGFGLRGVARLSFMVVTLASGACTVAPRGHSGVDRASNESASRLVAMEEAAPERSIPAWTRKALALIEHIEEQHAAWDLDQNTAQSESERKCGDPEAAVLWGLAMLHRTTGRCEYADVAKDELVPRAMLMCARYRAFLQAHGHEALEHRMRVAVDENIDLLSTDLWWPAFKFLTRRIDGRIFTPILTYPDARHYRWLVDEGTNEYIRDVVQEWWAQVRAELVWNPATERFEIVDPFATYDDDELTVADLAGLLSKDATQRTRLQLDMERIHTGTLR